MLDKVVTNIVMADKVMASIVMAYRVMAWRRERVLANRYVI